MSDIDNIYFFERCFPANYGLPFRPPIQPYSGKIDCSKEELQKQPIITNKGFRALVDCSEFEVDEISVVCCNQEITASGHQRIPEVVNEDGIPIKSDVSPRHMVQRFRLPDYYDSEDVSSSISENKILEIKAAPADQKKLRQ